MDELSTLRTEVIKLRQEVRARDAIISELEPKQIRRCRDCEQFKSEGIFMVCRLTYRRKSPDGYCDEACAKEEAE